MSAEGLEVCSCCWMLCWLPVSDTTILSTYALRTESTLALHAGLRTKTMDFVAE